MLRLALLASILLAAGHAAAFTHWNDIRASALLPGDLVTIRVEGDHGAGVDNTILHADGGIQETPLAVVADGPSTLEATVPGPEGTRRYYGFRRVQGDDRDLLPVRIADGVTPARDDLSRVAADPVGDEVFGLVNLDLVDCRVSRDETHLYAALTNAGGGFPVSSGLTFFSYLLGINNPAVADPDTVFALIHTVDVAGIMQPGLYQINGTGLDDLVRIGDITATEYPAENTLVLSCLLADLEANPVFQAWYDPSDPRLDVAGFSQRITVFDGAEEADSTPGGSWHLRTVALDPGANQLPQLADLLLPEPGSGGRAMVTYTDADGHCPVQAELVIDGVSYPLRPLTLDYDEPVVYRSEPGLPPLESGAWLEAVARFSDNAVDVVELVENAVAVADARVGLQLRAAPNPFAGRTEIAFVLDTRRPARLSIFDVAGRRVTTLVDGTLPAGRHVRAWNGRDGAGRAQPAGVYFYRLESGGEIRSERLLLVR